jgi:hypothetical protein
VRISLVGALLLTACETSFSVKPTDSDASQTDGAAGTGGSGATPGAGGGPRDASIDQRPLDASGKDGADTSHDAPSDRPMTDVRPIVDASGDARDSSLPPCQSMTDCPTGQNCMAGRCVGALVSCAAQKTSYPNAPDGVYWISPSGLPYRAFCDMAISAELCSEIEGDHRGTTRDKAAIPFTMRSILLAGTGVCRIWALRGVDGYPFTHLAPVNGIAPGFTCRAFGFVGDDVLGTCDYGSELGNCGFAAPPFYVWGNQCAGCPMNNGDYDRYTLQGPVSSGRALTSVQGTVVTTCRVR